MNTIQNPQMLEIIFQHRNKNYGAYMIRKEYEKSVGKAFFFTTTCLTAISILALSWHLFFPKFIPQITKPTAPGIDLTERYEFPKPEKPEPQKPSGKTSGLYTVVDKLEKSENIDTTKKNEDDLGLLTLGQLGGKASPGLSGFLPAGGLGSMPSIMPIIVKPEIYVTVDQVPQFPGGMAALNAYLENNLIYPQDMLAQSKEGHTEVIFVVNENGEVSNVRVSKSDHESFSVESARAVEKMPRWKAGKIKGKPVKTYYKLPIDFGLDR
jgi:protein TonB